MIFATYIICATIFLVWLWNRPSPEGLLDGYRRCNTDEERREWLFQGMNEKEIEEFCTLWRQAFPRKA